MLYIYIMTSLTLVHDLYNVRWRFPEMEGTRRSSMQYFRIFHEIKQAYHLGVPPHDLGTIHIGQA